MQSFHSLRRRSFCCSSQHLRGIEVEPNLPFWNSFLAQIKLCKDIKIFKYVIKKLFFNKLQKENDDI